MALQIGFSNRFYTLWDVNSSIEYGQASHGEQYSYPVTTYTYIQNLSFDLEHAQEKASLMGCKDLEPNSDLFGRNKSWKNYNKKNYCDFDYYNTPYNPYDETCFSELNKEGVLSFFKSYRYYNNIHVINRGIELGVLIIYDGDVLTIEEYNNVQNFNLKQSKIADLIKSGKTIDVELNFEKNLSVLGNFGFIVSEIGDIIFKNIKFMCYNGYEYALPTDNKGVGKKIKGKTLKLTLSAEMILNKECYIVDNFSILK